MTEAELILQKALVGSNLDSSQWNQIQAGFRNRAFFSSRVAQVNILAAMRDKVREYAEGETDISKIRMKIREDLQRLHYTPKPGEQDTIHDLFSQARLDVIIKTNVAQARGYMQYAEGMSPGAFAAFPAQEFTRIRHSRKPRQDWPQRWAKAGGKTYGGKMIALKDDPVWERLSVFGNPFPPFDWGSGMGVLDVDRKTAIQLRLISDEDLRGKTAALREKPVPDFNENLQATMPKITEKEWAKMKADFGDQIQRKGDIVAWRTDWFKEAFDNGNFKIRLGKPQSGLLSKLPQSCEFNGWQNGQLTIDQTWLNNKRDNGSDHRSHFKGYGNEANPLEKGDVDLLPCLWRNPDRAWLDTRKGKEGKKGVPRLILELDSFDGSTFRAVVDIGTDRPFLKTFFKKDPVGSAALIQAGAGDKHPHDISKGGKGGITRT